jgi:hypothetical protein
VESPCAEITEATGSGFTVTGMLFELTVQQLLVLVTE